MDSRLIADLLKKQRAALGLSIPTAMERTKIKRSYIEAMEEGDFSVFGNPVYTRNFVRTYARFLKIPDAEIMAMLGGEKTPGSEMWKPAEPAAAESVPELTPDDGRTVEKRAVSSIFLIVAVGIVVAGGLYLLKRDRAVTIPPSPVVEEPALYDTTAGGADPAVSPSGASDTEVTPDGARRLTNHTAEMTAVSDVWLYWEADNRRTERVMRPGERHSATFEKSLRLRAGNPTGLKLSIDGAEMAVDTGKVFDRIFRVSDDGRIEIAPTGTTDRRRFQGRESPENNP